MEAGQSSRISVGKLRGLGSFRPLCSVVGKHKPCLPQPWTTLFLRCSAAHPALAAAGTLCLPSPMVARQRELGSSDWYLLSKQLIQSLAILQGLHRTPESSGMMGDSSVGVEGKVPTASMHRGAAPGPERPCLRCPWGSLWEQLRAVQAPGAPGAVRKQLLCAADSRTLLTGSMGSPAGSFMGGVHGWAARTWALLIPLLNPKGWNHPCTKGTNTRDEACTKQTSLLGRIGE